jgi:hypothetical protein
MLSLGTAIAIGVAVVAFLVLKPSDEEESSIPQDAYTKALDDLCVGRKLKVARAQRIALAGGDLAAVSRYADTLVPIVGVWRMDLGKIAVPNDRAELVGELRAALLEVEIEAGTLARVAREANAREVAKAAPRVDAATENVEAAVDSLGLRRCVRLAVNQRRSA